MFGRRKPNEDSIVDQIARNAQKAGLGQRPAQDQPPQPGAQAPALQPTQAQPAKRPHRLFRATRAVARGTGRLITLALDVAHLAFLLGMVALVVFLLHLAVNSGLIANAFSQMHAQMPAGLVHFVNRAYGIELQVVRFITRLLVAKK